MSVTVYLVGGSTIEVENGVNAEFTSGVLRVTNEENEVIAEFSVTHVLGYKINSED